MRPQTEQLHGQYRVHPVAGGWVRPCTRNPHTMVISKAAAVSTLRLRPASLLPALGGRAVLTRSSTPAEWLLAALNERVVAAGSPARCWTQQAAAVRLAGDGIPGHCIEQGLYACQRGGCRAW